MSFELYIIILAVLGAFVVRTLIFNKHTYPLLAQLLTSEKQRRSYAYHESGHALALLKLDCGHELEKIDLSPSLQTGFLGLPFYSASHVNSKSLEDSITLEQAYNWLICELSGEAAENLLHGTPSKTRLSATHDKKTAHKIAQHIVKHQHKAATSQQLITKASKEAYQLMQDNHYALKELAGSLQEKKTLSASDAKAIT